MKKTYAHVVDNASEVRSIHTLSREQVVMYWIDCTEIAIFVDSGNSWALERTKFLDEQIGVFNMTGSILIRLWDPVKEVLVINDRLSIV